MAWRLALWMTAAMAAWLPPSGALVERWYSSGLFPPLQRAITRFSNLVPFALFDLVLLFVVGGVIAAMVLDVSRRRDDRSLRPRPRIPFAVAAGLRLATVAAAAYLAFLVCWGLNYRRQPIGSRVAFDASRVTADNAQRLAALTVQRVNTLYHSAHGDAWPVKGRVDPVLARAFEETQPLLGAAHRFVPARPKRSLLDLYFRRVGVAGMTDPYLLETLVASDLLVVEQPMVIAHEWSHLTGLADEGEANFAGWLVCLRGAPLHQYSAWLFLYGETAGSLSAADARDLAEQLDEGPRADLRAIRERILKQVSPAAAMAGWRIYDRYLKANRVDEGTRSYGEVVRLVLGTGGTGIW